MHQSPLFAPLIPLLESIRCSDFPSLHDCNVLLSTRHPPITTHTGAALHFVAQRSGKLDFEAQYEPRCYLRGEVQMRENNWHDLFNGLVWLTFPKTKAALNARHFHALITMRYVAGAISPLRSPSRKAEGGWEDGSNDPLTFPPQDGRGHLMAESAQHKTNTKRGSLRDTATLLDESGVIVVTADNKLADLLRDFRWKKLFWQRREQVKQSMGFYLLGHGLYEKALQPYVGMTGQGLILKVAAEFFGWPLSTQLSHLDSMLANKLDEPDYCMTTNELTPIPVLGVPGWSSDNACAEYYDNTTYFRPSRRRHNQIKK